MYLRLQCGHTRRAPRGLTRRYTPSTTALPTGPPTGPSMSALITIPAAQSKGLESRLRASLKVHHAASAATTRVPMKTGQFMSGFIVISLAGHISAPRRLQLPPPSDKLAVTNRIRPVMQAPATPAKVPTITVPLLILLERWLTTRRRA